MNRRGTSIAERRAVDFHETWMGMVQPIEGLVVSIPTLVEAQCDVRHGPELQQRLRDAAPGADDPLIADLDLFLEQVLGHPPDSFDRADALPGALHYWAAEGRQDIVPTLALRHLTAPQEGPEDVSAEDTPPAQQAAAPYVAFLWDLPAGLDFDTPEEVTGPWRYPPSSKFIRLLWHCRVPIGLLTNRRSFRLIYAPWGQSTGWIDFHLDHMAGTGGRPILDAFAMLLSRQRFFGVLPEHQLPALLEHSRKRQADVTNELAAQVFEALEILLAGFEAAAERDGNVVFREATHLKDDHLYGGLLTVLLRLVFLLYAEDKDLLPVSNRLYAEHFSLFGLFDELQDDAGAYPDSMDRRFGAWARLVSLFRAVYFGARHGDLHLPPRRGDLFNPEKYSFLEGRRVGGGAVSPRADPEQRAAVRLPSVDDLTVYRVLERLVILEGQRLSYSTLDVEQIGSVYEALMGYHVERTLSSAICLRPARVWVEAREILRVPKARRVKWLKVEAALTAAQAKKVVAGLAGLEPEVETDEAAAAEVLAALRVKGTRDAQPESLVIQPGPERRRTSSHYTPRSLSAPIVERTLEPLLAAMGEPSSEQILRLKVCDPAMGSGAFLVEACRFLAERLVEAWTREEVLEKITAEYGDDVLNHARRQVAQRCLYGVDKNPFAASLAKLSLWLVTMARALPFTFLDHALRHGDSLVGLDAKQLRSFHWKPETQDVLCAKELQAALDDAIEQRQGILRLAENEDPVSRREKEVLLNQADDAVSRVRLIGDLVVGAFFEGGKKKEREAKLATRLEAVNEWLASDGPKPPELLGLQNEIQKRTAPFHWVIEFPEVFYEGRRDPLDGDAVNRGAFFDAVIGNPPFAGKNGIAEFGGPGYLQWLKELHPGSHGNADYSAHFFRRVDTILGRYGTLGLIATNTIGQGDTRSTGLQYLVGKLHMIYEATRSLNWPGAAAVFVSVVHTSKGLAVDRLALDGERVEVINSRLRPKPERADPERLKANAGLSFVGSYVLGMGFTLTSEERAEFIAQSPVNAERIFPYLGGEEVNTSPTQSHHRYVINFGKASLAEAEKWPDLISIVREKVKPERDRSSHSTADWWHFERPRHELYEAISSLDRCLVNSQVSKYLVFAFQPTDRIFGHTLYAYPLKNWDAFATLQSRIHESWARLLSSSMKNDLRYTASDCFETFPFPKEDPREEIPELETIGEKLYKTRAQYMLKTDQGLTKTYNHLKNPKATDPAITHLRDLHLQMDRAVLTAYGWDDVDVPPFTEPETEAEERRLEAFKDDVIDRLFVLNQERAQAEKVLGLTAKGKGGKKRGAAKKDRGGHEGQGRLF